MRPRGCLKAIFVLLALGLIACVVALFVGLPRLRNSIATNISDALSTEVANQLSNVPGTLDPGSYTVTISELQQEIGLVGITEATSEFQMSVNANGMSIRFTSGNQIFGYSGTPTARNGRLVMERMRVDNGTLGWIMPADRLGRTIESSINGYFSAQGLQIDSLQLGDNEITFEVSRKGS